jgi:CspA family cold shock protein
MAITRLNSTRSIQLYRKGDAAIVRRGKVKWFNENKGYGFIRQEDGKNIYVHYSDIVGSGFRTLSENENVEYDLEEGFKGIQAVRVKKIVQVK